MSRAGLTVLHKKIAITTTLPTTTRKIQSWDVKFLSDGLKVSQSGLSSSYKITIY